MHCVFVIRPLVKIDHPILFFIWSLHFLSLILVAYDYFVLTCSDPVDNLILEPERVKQMQTKFELYEQKIQQGKMKTNPFQLKFCQQCLRTVRSSSYHCWTCGRCVQQLDHHCKYLNNCIGATNYFSFFRFLSCLVLYFICSIIMGIWVFIRCNKDKQINDVSLNKWAILIYFILGIVFGLLVATLEWFHCYISCYKRMTTLQYIFRDTSSNGASSIHQESNHSQAETEEKLK